MDWFKFSQKSGADGEHDPVKLGDVNSDSKIDIVDALLIAKYYVGQITSF